MKNIVKKNTYMYIFGGNFGNSFAGALIHSLNIDNAMII